MNNFFEQKVLPSVTLTDPDSACLLAEALSEGGVNILEVTFRTDATVSSLKKITKRFPELIVGAGTILSPDLIQVAIDAGAQFGLSPGFNESVVKTAIENDFPFIPGVMTPTDIERALDFGCKLLKVFPIKNLGGVEYIRSLEGPYAHTGVKFIPMGGVNIQNMQAYLECSSVLAVGGSWMTPEERIQNQDFQHITQIARKAVAIAGEVN